MFKEYRDAGFCVIPLVGGQPVVQWGQYQNKLPDDVSAWEQYKEYALVCGAVSKVIALDIDTDDAETIAKIEAIAGVSPVKKIGSKGFTAFYRYNGERTQQWGGIIEILSDKHLTTIPPSKHRSKQGVVYKWTGPELIGADLPPLAPSFCAVMDILYPKPVRAFRDSAPRFERSHDSVELAQAEKMLSYISADCPRDEWVQIGMALNDEFGDTACEIWHKWSATAPAKYKYRDAQNAWRSFNGNGVSIGTLIHKAKMGGFRFEVKEAVRPKYESGITSASVLFDPHIDGLVGEIADWITSTSYTPQPILSLSAAIVFMGLVKSHRVRGHTNFRTNVYCLSMAPTGGGKEHPETCIGNLAHACGLGKHLMGKPVSGSGLLTGLSKADGRGLMCLSEIGHYVANITDKRAGGYQKEIGTLMIELSTKAGSVFVGNQYSNERDNPQSIIAQPSLSILGSSVPERMQGAITGAEIVDGFLNRWISFATSTRPPITKTVAFSPPPDDLVAKIKQWMVDNPTNTDNYGKHYPKEMVFTPEAFDLLMAYKQKMRDLLDMVPYPINQLYVRSAEHAEKVAMIITDGDVMGTPELNKAIEIITQSNKTISEFCRGISESPHDQQVYKMLQTIKNSSPGGIKKRDLTRATQYIDNRKRADIIFQLIESEEIHAEKDGKSIVYKYVG